MVFRMMKRIMISADEDSGSCNDSELIIIIKVVIVTIMMPIMMIKIIAIRIRRMRGVRLSQGAKTLKNKNKNKRHFFLCLFYLLSLFPAQLFLCHSFFCLVCLFMCFFVRSCHGYLFIRSQNALRTRVFAVGRREEEKERKKKKKKKEK